MCDEVSSKHGRSEKYEQLCRKVRAVRQMKKPYIGKSAAYGNDEACEYLCRVEDRKHSACDDKDKAVYH